MKRCFSLILILAFARTALFGQGVTDFFDKISSQPVDSIIGKVDALIESPSDPAAMADVAGLAFDYFRSSPLMGHDAVAVHVADKYFLSNVLKWSDSDTYPVLYAFAEFNRLSLIGCEAQELVMEDISGARLSLRNDAGQYKLLYFYDPLCSTCRQYSSRLAEICRNYGGGRLSVFAINTGSDISLWKSYVSEKFSDINAWKVDFHNVWDPEDENDYHRKYGVLSTPAMVLVDSQNRIIGRSLDPDALETLLGVENGNSRSYKKLYRQLFSALAPVDTAVVEQVASSLALRAAGDSVVWRDSFYGLFNYLRDNPNSSYQKGAAAVAEKYILGAPSYWSAEYLAKVRYALEMFRMNPPGAKAPDLTLFDRSGRPARMLSGRSKYTLVIFHIVNCPDCHREFKVLDREAGFLKKKGVRVICVYAGRDLSLWRDFIPKHSADWRYLSDADRISGMGEKYDISFVPKLYLLDRRGRIIAKEIDAETLISLEL